MAKKNYLFIPISIGIAFLLLGGIFHISLASPIQIKVQPPPEPSISLTQRQKIHPELFKWLRRNGSQEKIPVIIEWQREIDLTQYNDGTSLPNEKIVRRETVISSLKYATEMGTANILSLIQSAQREGKASHIRSYWISPIISLQAEPGLITQLAKLSEVTQVRLDQRFELGEDQPIPQSDLQISEYPFNLEMIDIDLAQQVLGLDGRGVVVANLDTGVDWQHPALINKYRGYNPHGLANHIGNWYVATDEPYVYPGDGHGHGTHTMGIMVGDDGEGNRIGVAPEAKWIAVKLFTNQGYTYESWIHDAFEWILAPNDDPALAPDIVNNSWGSSWGSDTRFQADVQALRSAGILPVFAAGNNGPNSGTVASPGSYPESFTVGAVDPYKVVASFSSRGPSTWEEIKPEVAAPGTGIRSSYPGGGYAIANGTSQAAPHVSGLAALLLQADPSLTPDDLEEILTSTSEPLGSIVPNSDTGWGLVNAYAAGLQTTQTGEISGLVHSIYGSQIAYPLISISSRDVSYTQPIQVTGEVSGTFLVALLPGRYDVAVSAFGFNSQTQYLVEVITGTRINLIYELNPSPVGSVFGQVIDLQSNHPLSATLTVKDTPLSVQTNSQTGAYSLALPNGTWQIDVIAEAHRIGHFTETVVAGNGYLHDIALAPAPRILLIDSGRWYYQSYADYYQEALDQLDYSYSLWSILNPFGGGASPADLPTSSVLSKYDLVIWSAPRDSPGWLSMNDVLTQYLSTGGDFLISGQDVAFLDASYESGLSTQPYLTDMMGIWFDHEENLTDLSGIIGTPLEGITFSLNTLDSSQSVQNPDAVTLLDPIMSQAVLSWANGATGGVTGKLCQPYRAAWLGYGLEGTGPTINRYALLDKLINWTNDPQEEIKIYIDSNQATNIGLPGGTVSDTVTIYNVGTFTDSLDLHLLQGLWHSEVRLSNGDLFDEQGTITLPGCSQETLTYTTYISTIALRNDSTSFHLIVQSQTDPQISQTITISAKTPAPILLVDDERWYDHEDKYINSLENLHIPYDYFETGGDYTPITETLLRYPIILWTTGYDWYAPLTPADEKRLSYYLDHGGRLMIASQDLLDVRYNSQFVRDKLGVAWANLEISPTIGIPKPGNLLNLAPEIWNLVYPFKNWSDGIFPTTTSKPILIDSNLQNLGTLTSSDDWRTAFYSFPLETLNARARQSLIGKSLLWISQFGESHLSTPSAAAEGSVIPITLTLRIADSHPQTGLKAILPLIPKTTLNPGSIYGAWNFEQDDNALEWTGTLTPGITMTMGAELLLNTGIPDGTTLSLISNFYDSQGLLVVDESPIIIDSPWMEISKFTTPEVAHLDETISFTITINNKSTFPTEANLVETLPIGLILDANSIQASGGVIELTNDGFTWAEAVPQNDQERINFQAQIQIPNRGERLVSKTTLEYDDRILFAWGVVTIPSIFYFPWMGT